MFMVLTSWLRVITWVHPVHEMNAAQRQTDADLWTKSTDLSHWPACRQLRNYIHHRYLLLLSPKADTYFTIPRRVEGWVDLDRWLVTYPDALSARKQSPIQLPSSNWAHSPQNWNKTETKLKLLTVLFRFYFRRQFRRQHMMRNETETKQQKRPKFAIKET